MVLTYRDLDVWRNSMDLTLEIYTATKAFPKEEFYGLTSQMRRCSVSIPSNISEGFMRKNTKEYIQFLYISLGSLGELDTQIEISKRLNYVEKPDFMESEIRTIRMQLYSLIKVLKNKL